MIVWSYGGGVQTAAIAVLVVEGALPRPDLIGMADTSRERQATWDYLHDVMTPYLGRVGLVVEVVPHSLARVDLYDKNGLTLVPAYTSEGRKSAFCSGEWKRDVMERWMRSKGVVECINWLGFSLDELNRATGKAHRDWCQPAYPLIDKMLTRAACLRLIEAAGLPIPSKSRCWCCPHQNAEEWREVVATPDEFARAIELDHEIREADELHSLFLHPQRVPLEMVDFGKPGDEFPLFRQCQDAGCWT